MGTIPRPACHILPGTVHPHMRGDNRRSCEAVMPKAGSPPHAWGQSLGGRLCYIFTRFTPTCVGTIIRAGTMACMSAVHPHMRGDNRICAWLHNRGFGSPPHAWGQSPRRSRRRSPGRFTPTCVGTIRWSGGESPRGPVHPHMRGDNTKITNN